MSSMYVFTRKSGSPICHVLLTVQNTRRRALFIGFLHKQNWAASTDINVIVTYWALKKTSSVAYNSGETQTCIYIFSVEIDSGEIVASVWQAEGPETVLYPNKSKWFFRCVMEKLLIFNICET